MCGTRRGAGRPAALRQACIELHGPRGAGKTTFVCHLLRTLGVTSRVRNPHLHRGGDLRPARPGGVAFRLLPLHRPARVGRRRAARPVRGTGAEAGRMARESCRRAAGSRPAAVRSTRPTTTVARCASRPAAHAGWSCSAARWTRMRRPEPSRQCSRRQALRRMGSLVLLLGLPEPAAPPASSRCAWPARDYTRVTIESDQPLAASHLLVDTPHRLVVDIAGLSLNPALRELVGKVRPDDPDIAGVRVGQYQPQIVRLVFDLKQPAARPEQFTRAPWGSTRYRLLFDLFPTVRLTRCWCSFATRRRPSSRPRRPSRTRWASSSRASTSRCCQGRWRKRPTITPRWRLRSTPPARHR